MKKKKDFDNLQCFSMMAMCRCKKKLKHNYDNESLHECKCGGSWTREREPVRIPFFDD